MLPAKRAHSDEELRKWTRVFLAAGWGAAVVDARTHRIDAANGVFARMHGCDDPAALTGRRFADFVALGRGTGVDWHEAMVEPLSYESVHRRLDGGTFPVLVNVTHLADHGHEAYVV